MKKHILSVLSLLLIASATLFAQEDQWAGLLNEDPQEFSVNGDSFTYGSHVYTMTSTFNLNRKSIGSGKVTFTNVPSGFEEFKTVYQEFLGKTPHGAAAMVPMAMEIYGRDRETGKKCLDLLCYSSSTVSSALSILRDKIKTGDSYAQRYLPAACLDGASYTNGYKPSKPYTIKMKPSVNKPQEMWSGDVVFYIYLDGTGGWDTTQRSVEVAWPLESEEGLFKAFNFPALYTQCRNIRGGKWQGLD